MSSILPRLENDRYKFVAILAGYANEMETFFTSNPGLRSRLPPAALKRASERPQCPHFRRAARVGLQSDHLTVNHVPDTELAFIPPTVLDAFASAHALNGI